MKDNYIGKVDAEWVDPAVELPPDEDLRLVRLATGDEIHAYFDHYCEKWHGLDVVAWLRIGGPSMAIPREKVQAAVDHAKRVRLEFNEIGRQDMANAFCRAEEIFRHYTGVTPTEGA